MIFAQLLLCALISSFALVRAGIESIDVGLNLTEFVRHRNRRSLIFTNSGSMKLSVGISIPIDLEDPIAWRSLVGSYSLQGGQYSLPTEPLYPWDKWEDTFARSMKKVKKYFDQVEKSHKPDNSRLFIYTALETLLNRRNGDKGRACLLRSICENAHIDTHVGMLAEVLNVILTPGKENLDPVYKEAHVAGASGADCLKLYAECPAGANVLDQYFDHI